MARRPGLPGSNKTRMRSEEHTSELQSPCNLVCRLLLEKNNIKNAGNIRARMEAQGSIFQSSSDTEVLLHVIAQSREQTFPAPLATALRRVDCVQSLVMI